MTDAAGQRHLPPINLERLRLQCERLFSFGGAARGILARWPESPAAQENAALALTLRVAQTLDMVKSVDFPALQHLFANIRFYPRVIDPNDPRALDDVRAQIRTPDQIIICQAADDLLIATRQTTERR